MNTSGKMILITRTLQGSRWQLKGKTEM